MSFYPYNLDIPFADDNPSDDQPLMQQNTNQGAAIWTQEHIGFGSNNGGTHIQTGFAKYQSSPSLPSQGGATNPSVAYPNAGIADVNNAQFYFDNPLATFPLSSIKAFGNFLTLNENPPTMLTQFNINTGSLSRSGNAYVIPLESGVTVSNNPVVFIYTDTNTSNFPTYTFTSNVLTITVGVTTQGILVNFVIIEI